MTKFNKKTDMIAIIAPASGGGESSIRLQNSIKLLEAHGFSCKYYDKIFNGGTLEYFAADKQIRFSHLKMAIEDQDVKIIWTFKGGYGSAEIAFDCLDLKPSGPKILIGFSDITVLHELFYQCYNMLPIHGPPVVGRQECIISVLQGQSTEINMIRINVPEDILHIEGPIVGGNLSIICNLIGTRLHPNTADKILFLEDVKEKGYRVHRNLMHMKHANLFQNVRAVIFCDFTDTDRDLEPSINSFCREHISNIPTFRLSGIGHSEVNYPITIGGNALIKEDKLTVSSPFELI